MAKANDTVIFAYDNSEAKFKKRYILTEFVNTVKEHKMKNGDELIYMCAFYLFCPFCSKVQQMDEDYDGPVLRYDELVTHPMILCCCESVLLMDTAKVVPRDQVKQEYTAEFSDDYVFIEIKLAFIKKVINRNLSIFSCGIPLPDDIARQFSDEYNENDVKEFLKTNEIAKKYDIKIRKDSDPETKDICDTCDAENFSVGIAVNSYDLAKPAKPYPESMDVNPLQLLCADEYGEDFCVEYY